MSLKFRDATLDDVAAIAGLQNAAAGALTARFGQGHWSSLVSERAAALAQRHARVRIGRDGKRILTILRLATKKPWAIDVSYFTTAPVRRRIALHSERSCRKRPGSFDAAEILTENLKLLLQTPEEVLASIEAMSPSDRAEVSLEWLARVKASTSADPWMHGFAMVHRASGTVIGSCGYKGPPGPEAVVEIAYGVDPAYHGRGYATEAARALIAFALDSGQVRLVRAHTRPQESASTRVLTKCKFERVGEVVDPEDGLVWRWELQLSNEEL